MVQCRPWLLLAPPLSPLCQPSDVNWIDFTKMCLIIYYNFQEIFLQLLDNIFDVNNRTAEPVVLSSSPHHWCWSIFHNNWWSLIFISPYESTVSTFSDSPRYEDVWLSGHVSRWWGTCGTWDLSPVPGLSWLHPTHAANNNKYSYLVLMKQMKLHFYCHLYIYNSIFIM